jgi:signal transduction histidine kinase
VSEHDRALDDLREVIAVITHQLKTPLTSLLGYTSVLRRKAEQITPEQQREYIGVIEEQAGKILHLVEELLASSRVPSGGVLQRKPLDVGAIARDVASEFATTRHRSIDVTAPMHDLGLYGDRAAIEHVLGNLLDNAVKYSSEGSPIEVEVEEGEGEVMVSVRDEGIGIGPDDLERIFERFERGGGPTSRGSAGLGLYIVRNLVDVHGGRVWAESELTKGTTITFTLPLRRG